LLSEEFAMEGSEHSFTWSNISFITEATRDQGINSNALRGKGIAWSEDATSARQRRLSAAKTERTDPIRVTKGEHPNAIDQKDDRIGSFDSVNCERETERKRRRERERQRTTHLLMTLLTVSKISSGEI
jgi:hypothetical protein